MATERSRRRGFSLVETLVCLAIVTMLSGGLYVVARPSTSRQLVDEANRLERWVGARMGHADRAMASCSFMTTTGRDGWRIEARTTGEVGAVTFRPRLPIVLTGGRLWQTWSYRSLVHSMTPAVRWTLSGPGGEAQVIVSGRGAVSVVLVGAPTGRHR